MLSTGASFPRTGYSGCAAIPKVTRRKGPSRNAAASPPPFGFLIAGAILATAKPPDEERRGTSSISMHSHFPQVMPPSTDEPLAQQPHGRARRQRRTRRCPTLQQRAGNGATHRPKRDTPRSIGAWPHQTAHCWTALTHPPRRPRAPTRVLTPISARTRTRAGRLRFLLLESHRL